MPRSIPKTSAECRAEFMKRHSEWEKVNKPAGFATGEVHKAWNRRLKALDALVRANERERKKKTARQ